MPSWRQATHITCAEESVVSRFEIGRLPPHGAGFRLGMQHGARPMPDDRQIWTDLLASCERDREEQFSQLRPLQSGEMRHAKRRADGGEWVDVTDQEIASLRRIIANLDGVIARVRERLHDA
jgi:hypothetical protein